MPAKKTKVTQVLATEEPHNNSKKTECFSYNIERQMCSSALERRLYGNNFDLKQVSTIVKSFSTKAPEYKAV